MDKLTAEDLKNHRKKGESISIEYKESIDLNDENEILRQLTAFANRSGGILLYGICDDGSMEGAIINADSTLEKISNIVRDKTSPLIEFTPSFYHGADGDVLAIEVIKRRGIPCAVVKRSHHEIEQRKYYIRNDYGVRLMDDKTLEWLFLHQEDPAIEKSFRICVQYNRDNITLPAWIHFPMLIPQSVLIDIFQSLNEEQRVLLKSKESQNMMDFLAEIVPYVIIQELSRLYNKSWKIQINHVGDFTTYSAPTLCAQEQINLDSLVSNEPNILIKKMSLDISSIFVPYRVISVPLGTSINVIIDREIPHSGSSFIIINKEDAFNITFRITAVTWAVGAAPGHPIGYAFGGYQRVDEYTELYKEIAHTCINIDILANFEFPDIPSSEFTDYYEWVQQLVAELESSWDWDKIISKLPPGILYSIERDIKDILNRLKDK